MITIENVNRVINQIEAFYLQTRFEVSEQIHLYGDRIVSELQVEFPDLTIIGQFFPNNMEYWIQISRMGVEITNIKCPISNLFFTRQRDELGKQEFKSSVPELDIDKILQRMTNELSLQINSVMGRK